MNQLDSNMYYSLKTALRTAVENMKEDKLLWGEYPVILIDFHAFEAICFENESQTEDHLQKYAENWDDGPPEGEDEELIVYKFCDEKSRLRWPSLYRDYKFYKEINGAPIYRKKSIVSFEPYTRVSITV